MAATIEGAKGSRWTAPEWVARNMLEFLLPALRSVGLAEAADRLQPGADRTPPLETDLSVILEDPQRTTLWERAVAAAVAAVDTEAGAGWAEPQRFPQFRASVERLHDLGLPDGNTIVVRIAERIV